MDLWNFKRKWKTEIPSAQYWAGFGPRLAARPGPAGVSAHDTAQERARRARSWCGHHAQDQRRGAVGAHSPGAPRSAAWGPTGPGPLAELGGMDGGSPCCPDDGEAEAELGRRRQLCLQRRWRLLRRPSLDEEGGEGKGGTVWCSGGDGAERGGRGHGARRWGRGEGGGARAATWWEEGGDCRLRTAWSTWSAPTSDGCGRAHAAQSDGAVGADRWAPTTVRQRRQGRQAADMWAPPIVAGLNFPQFGQNRSNPIKFQFQTRSNFDWSKKGCFWAQFF
jgi:hypothetical protein